MSENMRHTWPDFNQKPCSGLQMSLGILHRTIQLASFNAGSRLGHIAGVRLPATTTATKKREAQASDQHRNRATVSIRGVEFNRGHYYRATMERFKRVARSTRASFSSREGPSGFHGDDSQMRARRDLYCATPITGTSNRMS